MPYTITAHLISGWTDKVKNQDSSLFEEGWFNGRANSENTFMSRLQDHEDFYL